MSGRFRGTFEEMIVLVIQGRRSTGRLVWQVDERKLVWRVGNGGPERANLRMIAPGSRVVIYPVPARSI